MSTNKVESEITDLAHVQIDVTSQRVVAIAECIYSDSLNLNRNAEYRSFYRSGVYNMGMHRIVEFNIYIEEQFYESLGLGLSSFILFFWHFFIDSAKRQFYNVIALG